MVGDDSLVWPIPDAPPRDVLVQYQGAHLRRLRALFDVRLCEQRAQPVTEAAAAHAHAGAELAALERAHAIPFAVACRALELTPRERDLLVLIAAPHLDDDLRRVIARFWDRSDRAHVDAALAVALHRETLEEALAIGAMLRDGGRLHTAGLIESVALPVGHHPSALEHELVPNARLLRLFAGEVGLDPRLRAHSRLVAATRDAAQGVVDDERVDELVALVRAAHDLPRRSGPTLLLAGPAGTGKVRMAQAVAARLGRRSVLVVEAAFLPADPLRLERILATAIHEAEIMNAQLVLRRIEHLVDGSRMAAILGRVLGSRLARVWATSETDPARNDAPHLVDLAVISAAAPIADAGTRRRAWQVELDRARATVTDATLTTLAREYPMSRRAIERATLLATASAADGPRLEAVLPRIAESQMRGQLARFARRSRSQTRLEHLVLPENTRELVHELVTATRRRAVVMDRWGLADRHAAGRGIVAMFNGPPGTGKTMTAAAIANELDLPLYRIDVSNLVDRFVGETEKNLVRMFDEAMACRAVLLFDEADSLFGKRIAAEDATDRYANMQVNLLLNLIEDYDGFVVLTTNLKGALDDAFLRRIVYKIVFEMPDREELVALWDYHLPPSIPRAPDLDLGALADEFEDIAGGDIKNAVLRAALAAGGDQPISHEMLRHSMISELRANGSVVSDRR